MCRNSVSCRWGGVRLCGSRKRWCYGVDPENLGFKKLLNHLKIWSHWELFFYYIIWILKWNILASTETPELIIAHPELSSTLLFFCIPGRCCLALCPPQVSRHITTLALLQCGLGDGGGSPASLSAGATQRFQRLQKLKIKVEEEHKQRPLIGPLNRWSPASFSRESKWRSRQGAHNTTLTSQPRNISAALQQEAWWF